MSRELELRIHNALSKKLNLHTLIIENESRLHQGPPDAETHFKIIAVSSAFENVNRLNRHKIIYDLLAEEFKQGLHALTLSLQTPTEWEKNGKTVARSPACRHSNHPAKKLNSKSADQA